MSSSTERTGDAGAGDDVHADETLLRRDVQDAIVGGGDAVARRASSRITSSSARAPDRSRKSRESIQSSA